MILMGLLLWSSLSWGIVATIPADVTGQIKVSKSKVVYNPVTKTYSTTLTLTNTSKATIYGPITVSVILSDPTNISLANSIGLSTAGNYPVVSVSPPKGVLKPGASICDVPLQFNNPNQKTFTYNLDMYAAIDPSAKGTASITGISPNGASTGTLITLNGSGFTKTSKVYFGKQPLLTPNIISDKQISVMVPFNTNRQGQLIPLAQGVYPIKVDNSISYNFTVTALPANPNPASTIMNTVISGLQNSYNNLQLQTQTAINDLSSLNLILLPSNF
jgi:IPT/TIG domain